MIERFFSLNGIIHSSRFQLTSVSLRGPLNAVHKCGQKQAHTLFLYSTLHCLSKAGWLRFQLQNSGLLRNFYNLKKSIILFGPTLASITAMPTSKQTSKRMVISKFSTRCSDGSIPKQCDVSIFNCFSLRASQIRNDSQNHPINSNLVFIQIILRTASALHCMYYAILVS